MDRPSVSPALTLEAVILTLGLKPHPEGGFYREMHRVDAPEGQRSPGTAIYYALGRGDGSHWHRVDAVEIWHFYAGAPLELSIAADGETDPQPYVLGAAIGAGQRPQIIVPKGYWQSAVSTGDWTLAAARCRPASSFRGSRWRRPGGSPAARRSSERALVGRARGGHRLGDGFGCRQAEIAFGRIDAQD